MDERLGIDPAYLEPDDDVQGYIRLHADVSWPVVLEARTNIIGLLAIGATVTVRAIAHGQSRPEGADAPDPGELTHFLAAPDPAPFCMVAQMNAGLPFAESMRAAGYVAVSKESAVSCDDCLGWLHA